MTTLTPGRMAAPLRKMGIPLLVLPLVCAVLLALPGRALGKVVAEKKFSVVKIDIVGHWPGTMAAPGEEVAEQDEEDTEKLMVGVNDDDDNYDDVADNDRANSPTIVAEDDEILTFTLVYGGPKKGQLELSSEGTGLRVFDEAGENEIPLPATVNLENPAGPLADLASGSMTVRLEADAEQDEAKLLLRYLYGGTEVHKDEVHFLVLNFEPLGGVGRGASPTWANVGKLNNRYIAGGNIGVSNPFYLLVRVPGALLDKNGRAKAGAKIFIRKMPGGPKIAGTIFDTTALEDLTSGLNAIISGLNLIIEQIVNPLRELYGLEPLNPIDEIPAAAIVDMVFGETGVPSADLIGGGYFEVPDASQHGGLTQPGDYELIYQFGNNVLKTDQLLFLKVAMVQVRFEDAGGADGGNNEHPLRKDNASPVIQQPVWKDANIDGDVFDPGDKDFPVCYTMSGVGMDSKLRVDIGLNISEAGLNFNVTGDESLHSPSEYFRKDGNTSTDNIQTINDIVAAHSLPDHVDSTEMQFRWKVVLTDPDPDVVCFAGLSTHTVYTVLDTPKAPMAVPWIEVLDYSCSDAWAGETSDAVPTATAITKGMYNSGFVYDRRGSYASTSAGPYSQQFFYLEPFLVALKADNVKGACQEVASVVQIFGNAIGLEFTYQTRGEFYYPNYVFPIGASDWVLDPLVANGMTKVHQWALLGNKVFDATYKLTTGTANPLTKPAAGQGAVPTNWDYAAYYLRLVRSLGPPPGSNIPGAFNVLGSGTVQLRRP